MDARSILRDAFFEVLSSLSLERRVEDALPEAPAEGRVVVVAMGKSAAPMLAGAAKAWGPRVERVVVARPERAVALTEDTRVLLRHAEIVEKTGAHPTPDASSVEAARAVREAVTGLSAEDTVLVLLSGGASASVCSPREGVTLDVIRDTTRRLLAAGVAIETINAVRGTMESLKRGGLLRAALPARVLTVASLDVLGEDAVAMETLGGAPTRGGEHVVVARPADARDAMRGALSKRGLRVAVGDDVRGEADHLIVPYALYLRAAKPGDAWVAVGEPTVTLPRSYGRGGRSGRLALGVAREVAGVRDVAFLAAGTDGVDGTSPFAGAAVDGATWKRADGARAFGDFDDATFHADAGSGLETGPTGLNLLDVHALVRIEKGP